MKKFNLEEALNGKPVITRDGCKVMDIKFFGSFTGHYPLVVHIQKSVLSCLLFYTEKGRFANDETDSPNDLFMVEEEMYVVLLRDGDRLRTTNRIYYCKDDAIITSKNCESVGVYKLEKI